MTLHISDALNVLRNGLPPAQIIHTTSTVSLYVDAPLTTVFQAVDKNYKSYGNIYQPWHNAFFPSCKDAFAVVGAKGTVTAAEMHVTADGRLYRAPVGPQRFYAPPPPDAQLEGNEVPVNP